MRGHRARGGSTKSLASGTAAVVAVCLSSGVRRRERSRARCCDMGPATTLTDGRGLCMVRVCCCFELAVQAEAEQLRRENARCVPCGTRSTAHGPYKPTRHATQHATYSVTQRATTESLRPAALPRCAGSWLRRLWQRKRTRWASDQAALRCRPPRETSSLVRPMRSHCARAAACSVTTAPGARSRQRTPRPLPLGQPRTLRATGHFRARARAPNSHAHCCRLGAGSDRRASCTHAAPRPAA